MEVITENMQALSEDTNIKLVELNKTVQNMNKQFTIDLGVWNGFKNKSISFKKASNLRTEF